eukprot:1130707-Prymnesium_polylepis.1
MPHELFAVLTHHDGRTPIRPTVHKHDQQPVHAPRLQHRFERLSVLQVTTLWARQISVPRGIGPHESRAVCWHEERGRGGRDARARQ